MKANNTRSEAAGSSGIYGLFSRFHESRCLWDLHCPSPQLLIGLSAMKDPCSKLPNTSAGGGAACPEVCPAQPGRKALTPGKSLGTGLVIKVSNSSSWASPKRSQGVSSWLGGGLCPAAPWALLALKAQGCGKVCGCHPPARRPRALPHPARPALLAPAQSTLPLFFRPL